MLVVKYIHIVSVTVTFALFFVRGLWLLRSYPSPQERWIRYLPYFVDAILITSALVFFWAIGHQGYPGQWFTVKLILIVVYAFLATAVLNFARGFGVKVLTWGAALLIFLFVTTIAVLHHPLGVLSLL